MEAHGKVERKGRFWFPWLLVHEWNRIGVSALASQVAYSLIFAIPSLILFMMAIAALVDRHTRFPVADRLRSAIEDYAPESIRQLLISIVDEAISQVSSGFASVSVIIAVVVAVWGASGGINALMNACNRAYGVPDTRFFIAKRILALLLTGVFAVLVVASAVIFMIGERLQIRLVNAIGFGDDIQSWWSIIRWPAYVTPVAIALVLLYSIGSIARPPLQWTLPGALVAASAWIFLLWGFRLILGVINPGSPYGATGSVMVLLFFLYATGIVFILGAAINGLLVRFFRPAT